LIARKFYRGAVVLNYIVIEGDSSDEKKENI